MSQQNNNSEGSATTVTGYKVQFIQNATFFGNSNNSIASSSLAVEASSQDVKYCFVVMGFGDKKASSEYQLVLEHLIKPAAENQGYVVITAEELCAQKGGSKSKSVFYGLYTADLVIADLTSLSPTVMYETGIRHALWRKNTILISKSGVNVDPIEPSYLLSYEDFIIDENGEYDIRQKKLKDAVLVLENKIKATITESEPSTPVYDWIPLLNEKYRSFATHQQSLIDLIQSATTGNSSAEVDAVTAHKDAVISQKEKELAECKDELLKSNETVADLISQAQLKDIQIENLEKKVQSTDDEAIIESFDFERYKIVDFSDFDDKTGYAGSAIYERLRQIYNKRKRNTSYVSEDEKKDINAEIVAELNVLAKNITLVQPRDFLGICNLFNLENRWDLRKKLAFYAYARFPKDPDIFWLLIDSLYKSPEDDDHKLAISYAQDALKITKVSGQLRFVNDGIFKSFIRTNYNLNSLFNIYIRLNRWADLISIVDSAKDMLGDSFVTSQATLIRNSAIGHYELGNYREATICYKELLGLENANTDDYYRASEAFYHLGKYEIGYRFSELFAIADAGYQGYFNLAQDISNHRFIRLANGKIEHQMNNSYLIKTTLPLLFKVMQICNDASGDELENVVRVLYQIMHNLNTNARREGINNDLQVYDQCLRLFDEKNGSDRFDYSFIEAIIKCQNSDDILRKHKEALEILKKEAEQKDSEGKN